MRKPFYLQRLTRCRPRLASVSRRCQRSVVLLMERYTETLRTIPNAKMSGNPIRTRGSKSTTTRHHVRVLWHLEREGQTECVVFLRQNGTRCRAKLCRTHACVDREDGCLCCSKEFGDLAKMASVMARRAPIAILKDSRIRVLRQVDTKQVLHLLSTREPHNPRGDENSL